jgi:hypothetical protein
MPAPNTSRTRANFNHLRRGGTYRATTPGGTAVGEYLGMEALYGDRAVLLRHAAGTDSIYQRDVISIEMVAA